MAKEKQRSFDLARRMVQVVVEDDAGVQHRIQAHNHVERCPMCQRDYPKTREGHTDVQALVDQLVASLDAEMEDVVAFFEKHGADMSKEKAAIAARKANAIPPGNNQAGH